MFLFPCQSCQVELVSDLHSLHPFFPLHLQGPAPALPSVTFPRNSSSSLLPGSASVAHRLCGVDMAQGPRSALFFFEVLGSLPKPLTWPRVLSPQRGHWPHGVLHRSGCDAGHGGVRGRRGHLQLREDPLLPARQHDPDRGGGAALPPQPLQDKSPSCRSSKLVEGVRKVSRMSPCPFPSLDLACQPLFLKNLFLIFFLFVLNCFLFML